ncbi:hypothetical protein AN644_00210 [Candidatus Epulonipiscium fishelsonii]|nr:hypothetical protein AN644_00210 [Epulopiscium sp. SCG-C06WGA-EpuloA1]
MIKANRDIKSLNPLAQFACEMFLRKCQEDNVPIFITETYRSQERQDYLYGQGRTHSLNKPKVTWTKVSNHTGRMAWDIAVSPPHRLYDKNILSKAGDVAKSLGITWGGTWKVCDTPHFEINSSWELPGSDWAHTEVLKAINLGLTTGERLDDDITRREVIVLLIRLYNILKKENT